MILTLSGLLVAAGLNVVTAGPAAAIPGLANVSVATAFDSSDFKSVSAPCPAGKRVIGGGARLTFATGEVAITHLAPDAAGTAYEAQAYEDADGFAGNWGLTVTAVCANMPPGYTIVTAASPMASPATASAIATCPSGLRVLGTGGSVSPGRGVVLLTGVIPESILPSRVRVTGAEIAGGFADTWNVQSWAICVVPVGAQPMVTTVSAGNSVSPKTQSSWCTPSTYVHGVGFQLGGVGELFLNAAFPNPPNFLPGAINVPVQVSEDQSGYAGNWGIRTMAICQG